MEKKYKQYMISKTEGEYWIYHPSYRMYKIPKFKTIEGAKRWVDKKTKGYLPEANIPQTLKVIKKIKRK